MNKHEQRQFAPETAGDVPPGFGSFALWRPWPSRGGPPSNAAQWISLPWFSFVGGTRCL